MSNTSKEVRLKAGGAIDAAKHAYVVRLADKEVFALLEKGEYVNVLCSRQMGKTSLIFRARMELNKVGVKTAYINVDAQLGTPGSAEEWYLGLLQSVTEELGLSVDVSAWWQSRTGTANQRLIEFFRYEVVADTSKPVVIIIDEIDSTLKLPYTDDFFVAIRGMYNDRSREPAFEQIGFCLVGVATPNELIKDRRSTSYNVGRSIELKDFDPALDDLGPLCRAVANDPQTGEALVRAVVYWTGGHPYLTQRLCDELTRLPKAGPKDLENLVERWFPDVQEVRSDVHFDTILRFVQERISDRISALSLYRRIYSGHREPDRTTHAHISLKLSGLVKRDLQGMFVVRNPIYRRVFTDRWAEEAMPALIPRVFVSATTHDLGSFRKAVGEILVKLGALPVEQDHFTHDYRSVVAMLREKIGECDAAICLIGRRYENEPFNPDADQPRRSYTQLEYDIAVELDKPLFVFVAADGCALDAAPDEPDELRRLQLEHRKRIVASDRVPMQFHSLGHLTDQVRVLRFDAESLAKGVTSRLAVLMTAELIGVEAVRERRGELAWVRDVVQPFHELLQESLTRWSGTLRAETSSAFEVNFETADAAVNAALALHDALRWHGWKGPAPGLRVGIHVGQVVQFGGVDESRVLQASHTIDQCRQLTRLAVAGQTLLTRTAFEIAREHVRQAPYSGKDGADTIDLDWQSHGRYWISDSREMLEVYEVGVSGLAPFAAPPDSSRARRADSIEQQQIPPWRPAVGQEIPRRPGWVLDRKLGAGGFAEVWVARQKQNPLPRAFKFCFEASRLGSFKRERALFQLLHKTLGDRRDIVRLLDVNLEQGPFFLESEYVEGGNLREWCESCGRLAALPLEERLRMVAEIGKAVAAAHSVDVIHNDLKPTNVLMRQGPDGLWHPSLADFGIGGIADRSQLEQRGILFEGWTRLSTDPDSIGIGTGMYQPPEVILGRTATVQGDVYALGVMLYQMIIGDFDQPMSQGFERRLEAARARGWAGEGETSPEPRVSSTGDAPSEARPEGLASPNCEIPSSTATPHSSPATDPPGVRRLPALDPTAELAFTLLKDDIGACVDGDASTRLASAAQLVERLQTLDKRIADGLARRRAETVRIRVRRLGAALATSIAVLFVVGGLSAVVFRARIAADQNAVRAAENEQRAVANERRADASEKKAQANAEAAMRQSQFVLFTLNEVIFDIQHSVADLSESSPIRRRLQGTTLGRLEELSGEIVKLSTADRYTARTLMSTGDLVLQFAEAPRSSDASGETGLSGELRGAVESAQRFYIRSMEIFRNLVQAAPNDAQAKRDLALSYRTLGDVHLQLRAIDKALQSYHIDKALQFYQADLKLREALAVADPDDEQARRDLWSSYNWLGDMQRQLGANDLAMQSYQEGLKLAKADPDDEQANRNLSISYVKLGDLQLKRGAIDQALQYFEKDLELCKTMAKAAPDVSQARRDLRDKFNWLGEMHLERGATDKALQFYQEGLKLSEALATDPDDAQAQRALSVSYNKLGDVYLKRGAAEQALPFYQEGLKLREELAARAAPEDAQARRDLAISHNQLGDVHLKRGATSKALRSYQQCSKLREALAKADPDDVQAQQDLSRSYCKMAQAYERANDLVRARPWYEKMLGVDKPLSERFPQIAAARREVAADCQVLTQFCARARDWTAAVSYARQAIDHARAARQIAGARQSFQWDFSITLRYLGDAQKGAGQLNEARQNYEEAIRAGPKSPAAHTALAWFLATCWDDSIRDGTRAVAVATQLCELTEWKNPRALDTLAASYAEAGQFDDAVKWEQKALKQPDVLGPAGLEQAKARLKLFEAHKAYHEPRPEPAGPSPNDPAQSR
jgi:serine/threonine protein kinase/tetratricopeptide (TPR) repeat protein